MPFNSLMQESGSYRSSSFRQEINRIVVLADSRGKDDGINEPVLRSLLQQIKELNPPPRYIVFPGDLVSGSKNLQKLRGELKKFKRVFMEYFPIEILLPTVGNHEVGSGSPDDARQRVFSEVFSEYTADNFLRNYNRTVYYVDYLNTRLILLNSYHTGENNRIIGRQLEWFKKAVEDEDIKHKMVFLHSPPYPTGAHMGSSLNIYPEDRDRFWNIIDKSNVAIVFAGHEHNYSRRIINGNFSSENYQFIRSIPQIVTGGAGAPLRDAYHDDRGVIVPPLPVYHFVLVDIEDDRLRITAISEDEEILDDFELVKNNRFI